MIVADDTKAALENTNASSSAPPPTFEESVDHVVLDFSHQERLELMPGTDSDIPPEFAFYEADFVKAKDGSIVSHDPHLNEDGEALYRFLLSQASIHPTFLLCCRGTHDEPRTRVVSHTNKDGRVKQRTESYTETVVDFDFKIDIGMNLPTGKPPVHWSVPDLEPAYRGKMVREIELGEHEAMILGKTRRKAGKSEIKVFKAWESERIERGLPPWTGSEIRWHATGGDPMVVYESEGLRSSRTLRTWADEYCASKKYLKEFTYVKVVYGWNTDALKSAIHATILSTYYMGSFNVSLITSAEKIQVRPNNRLSRMLSNPWLKFLLFITLVYPFLWLFQRFHSRGGGKWEVCGGAYALKRTVPTQSEGHDPDSKTLGDMDQAGPSSSGAGASRQTKVVGTKEGRWLREWEATIKQACATRMQSSVPMTEPQVTTLGHTSAVMLDGYTDY